MAENEQQPFVEIWGTGKPKREFLHADDLADACFFLMQNYNEPGLINIGTGEDISIIELAYLIKDIVGYEGEIKTNPSKPDGTPRKLMDVTKLKNLGWQFSIPLKKGIEMVVDEIKSKDVFKLNVIEQAF